MLGHHEEKERGVEGERREEQTDPGRGGTLR